jgi:hypothetical protein
MSYAFPFAVVDPTCLIVQLRWLASTQPVYNPVFMSAGKTLPWAPILAQI